MRFRYEAVERIPKPLMPGVVYHSEEFEIGALLCACGCGHRVSLLVPDSHQVTEQDGMATVRPSIAVCDSPCNSHYIITTGEVEWLRAFDPATSKAVMHKQIARHAQGDPRRLSLLQRVLAALGRAWTWLISSGSSR
ncbi:hypothetical protein ELH02_14115 [Rhizobium ruizarguesonis]|uniref:DUF6527 family protein n=1 Tax=Rhizobium ruizarguesonis TaxID=2081791 RepID=UPI001031EBB2|nr:DUF6527 family protein [Rhizobium ruizarguesonis]TBE45425.1 hypothetical protein ELH02_14115 [Rhizobium ruizarguesonis]